MDINQIAMYVVNYKYVQSLVIFVFFFLISKLVVFVSEKILLKLTDKTVTNVDDLIVKRTNKPISLLLLFIGIRLAIIPLSLSEKIVGYASNVIATFVIIIIGSIIIRVLNILINEWGMNIARKEESKIDEGMLSTFHKLGEIIIIIIVLLFMLDNWGIKMGPLLASLGIAGVAIAFALQNVLGDIFASFSIYFDRPFKVGDFIIVGKELGVVKKIGIKTTRLESLWGQEIIISNRELTSTRINNYKKMEKRRIHFNFGVVYETPVKKLKEIPKMVEDIFDKIKLVDLNRVHFKEFGDFSLDFEVAYYVNTSDYNKYMDIQQEINFAIKETFENNGIEFAYPTQKVFVAK